MSNTIKLIALLTMHSRFDTDQGFDSAVEVFGAVEGAEQTLGRLAAFVEGGRAQ